MILYGLQVCSSLLLLSGILLVLLCTHKYMLAQCLYVCIYICLCIYYMAYVSHEDTNNIAHQHTHHITYTTYHIQISDHTSTYLTYMYTIITYYTSTHTIPDIHTLNITHRQTHTNASIYQIVAHPQTYQASTSTST